MSVQVAKSRFIISSLVKHSGFYQYLLGNFEDLGNALIQEAETSIAYRQVKGVEEAGVMLSSLPVKEYQIIGHYYQGWALYRSGGDARSIFEDVIEKSKRYRAKALISLAAVETRKNDYTLAYSYYNEALKYATSPSTALTAAKTIAAIKGNYGDHSHALKDLERLLPLAQYADPKAYYDYMNSFAVELNIAGRVEEAGNVCKIILASPFAFAYPEWRETSNDIALRGYKSRSVISFTAWNVAKNVLYLPERSEEGFTQSQPGTVTTLDEWKEKMVKEPNGDIEDMGDKDLFMEIMHLASQETITTTKLKKILAAVQKITSEPDDN